MPERSGKLSPIMRGMLRLLAAMMCLGLHACEGATGEIYEAASEDGGLGEEDGGSDEKAIASTSPLQIFWNRYGSPASFPTMYVDVLTNLLAAERSVTFKNYRDARSRIDALLAKYPLSSDVWGTIETVGRQKASRPHLGEPGAYAAVRMLDEIARIGLATPSGTTEVPIKMTIVMPVCSNIVPRTGPRLPNNRLDGEITANSYAVVRQSLRLFQNYVRAISRGTLRLDLSVHQVSKCFEINPAKGFVIGNYLEPINQLPAAIANSTDMYWLIYPMDTRAGVDVGLGGGMGSLGEKPVFIAEDDWLVKKPASQGGGSRTEVERRVYLSEWLQHEFFHHLFRSRPELRLEAVAHGWFTRSTWPADFVGKYEEDYYAEALKKRFYRSAPSIRTILQRAGK